MGQITNKDGTPANITLDTAGGSEKKEKLVSLRS